MGELDPATKVIFGFTTTTVVVVETQPLASVTVTVYVPAVANYAFVIVGF